jgi:alpha-glucosidase
VDAEGHAWWQHAVFYEIYPRSFADSNHDGIGDIPGITSKLDYLHWLGADAIWIAPMFPSPQVDWGYDVSDYYNVNPDYGTLNDMDHGREAAQHSCTARFCVDLYLRSKQVVSRGEVLTHQSQARLVYLA